MWDIILLRWFITESEHTLITVWSMDGIIVETNESADLRDPTFRHTLRFLQCKNRQKWLGSSQKWLYVFIFFIVKAVHILNFWISGLAGGLFTVTPTVSPCLCVRLCFRFSWDVSSSAPENPWVGRRRGWWLLWLHPTPVLSVWAEGGELTPLLPPSRWPSLSGVNAHPPQRGGLYSIAPVLRASVLPPPSLSLSLLSSLQPPKLLRYLNQQKCLATGCVCNLSDPEPAVESALLLFFRTLEIHIDISNREFFRGMKGDEHGVAPWPEMNRAVRDPRRGQS